MSRPPADDAPRTLLSSLVEACTEDSECSGDEEYCQNRLRASHQMMCMMQPYIVLLSVVQGLGQWSSGSLSAWEAAANSAIPCALFAATLILNRRLLQKPFRKNFGTCAMILQSLFSMSVAWEVLTPSCPQRPGASILVILLAMQGYFNYVPDNMFFPYFPSVFGIGFAYFLMRIPAVPIFFSIMESMLLVCAMIVLRKEFATLPWRSLRDERELDSLRSSMFDLKDSNYHLLRILFDSWCTCDADMRIMQATPSMAELLDTDADMLIGAPLASLVVDAQRGKVRKSIEDAVKGSRAVVAQTSLRGNLEESGSGEATPCLRANFIDVKMFCMEEVSVSSSERGGGRVFVGLQQLFLDHMGGRSSGAASLVTKSRRSKSSSSQQRSVPDIELDNKEESPLRLIFEADSEGFQVVTCSPELQDMGIIGQSLLEMVNKRYRIFFDNLVWSEMKEVPEGTAWRSTKKLQDLVLELPGRGGMRIKARRAWLVINPESLEGCKPFNTIRMPVCLSLAGVRVRTKVVQSENSGGLVDVFKSSGSSQAITDKKGLTTIEEGSGENRPATVASLLRAVDRESDRAMSSSAMSSCCDSDLQPWDSASQVSSGLMHLRRQPHIGGSFP